MTTRHRSWYRAASLAGATILVAGYTLASPAAAQHHDHHDMAMPADGLRADLIADMDAVAAKYLALADVMTAHYAWRPGDGVRSMGEVLAHMAAANFMIPTMVGVALPEGVTMAEVQAMQGITDAAQIRETLEHSFRHARHAIAMTSDDDLDDTITMFGRDFTKRAALLLMATHAHEHLGQAIAYTRTNGVTPPWSAAAD